MVGGILYLFQGRLSKVGYLLHFLDFVIWSFLFD